jgi:protocatechuate 3,4-dioxygenase beta subunit
VLFSLAAGDPDKTVSVAQGATVEGIDFSLSRGGVITGKITDSEDRPLVGEVISLKGNDPARSGASHWSAYGRMYATDDRGVYRIFGIRPGRYIVSAGSRNPMIGLRSTRPNRVQTYYPGVTDEGRAKPVEVTAGAEASGIDIRLGAADKGFAVSGRVIDAETGKPIADAMVAYTATTRQSGPDGADLSGMPGDMTITNAKGEFRLESVAAGSYRTQVESMEVVTGTGGFYADPLNFEVNSANVEKLEIKIHQGASITGVVVVENANSSDVFSQGVTYMLLAQVTYAQRKDSGPRITRVAADGSFRIGGLKPGRAKIEPMPDGMQKLSLLRIERDGVEQPDGIDIQANDQITGVRVVVVPANCVIRGHVSIQGGLPDFEVRVIARPLNGNSISTSGNSRIDQKGDFVIENIGPGEYEVWASVSGAASGGKRTMSPKLTVTVTDGAPAEAALVLNLNAPDK